MSAYVAVEAVTAASEIVLSAVVGTSSLCGVVLSIISMRKDVRALSEPTMNRFYPATQQQHNIL